MNKLSILAQLIAGRSVCIAGPAENVIRQFISARGTEGLAVTSTSAAAAEDLGGETIWQWSGLSFEPPHTLLEPFGLWDRRAGVRIRATQTLIISEAQRLSSDFLATLNEVYQIARGDDRPFGGLQLLLAGDPIQSPSFTRSEAFRALNPVICDLDNATQDPALHGLLDDLRRGRTNLRDRRLQSRCATSVAHDIPIIYGDSLDALDHNEARLQELPGRLAVFEMETDEPPSEDGWPAQHSWRLARYFLNLKNGARVLFTRDDPAGRYVRGSAGTVIDTHGADGWPLVQLDGVNGAPGALVAAKPVSWETALPGCAYDSPSIRTRVRQVPLCLGWAISA